MEMLTFEEFKRLMACLEAEGLIRDSGRRGSRGEILWQRVPAPWANAYRTRTCQPPELVSSGAERVEGLAEETEHLGAEVSKIGGVVIKRRAGAGHQTPQLVVMTEMAWRRISAGERGAPARSAIGPQTDMETAEANVPPMKRPTPAIVRETIGVLRLAGTTVRPPVLVRALRDRGCSRASAYRAIHDALAAGTIKSS